MLGQNVGAGLSHKCTDGASRCRPENAVIVQLSDTVGRVLIQACLMVDAAI